MRIYSHPRFRDISMRVIKKFTLPHKVKLKVEWLSKCGKYTFGRYENLVMTPEKWSEFYRIE